MNLLNDLVKRILLSILYPILLSLMCGIIIFVVCLLFMIMIIISPFIGFMKINVLDKIDEYRDKEK